jgi:hypothetical protein
VVSPQTFELVCREMCKVDRVDPDEDWISFKMFPYRRAPLWRTYALRARAAIEVLEAAGVMK